MSETFKIKTRAYKICNLSINSSANNRKHVQKTKVKVNFTPCHNLVCVGCVEEKVIKDNLKEIFELK